MRHSLHRSTTELVEQPSSASPQPQFSYLQTIELSTQPGHTALYTTPPTGNKGSAIRVPSSSSSAFALLLSTKMAALWTPVRQHDLVVVTKSSGAAEGGGRIIRVGAFEICIAEIVPSTKTAGVLVGAGGDGRGTQGVAVAIRLAGADDSARLTIDRPEYTPEEQEQEKVTLRDFGEQLGLRLLSDSPGDPALAVLEEFWGDCSTWQGEVALWCQVLKHRALTGFVRRIEGRP